MRLGRMLIAVNIALALTSCNEPQNTIVGKWRAKNGMIMEFKPNGGLIYNESFLWIGVWKEEGKGRIRITTSGLGAPPPQVCNYEVKGALLQMSGCGPSFEMIRMN